MNVNGHVRKQAALQAGAALTEPSNATAFSPTLTRLLLSTARAVAAVRSGQSLTPFLAQCPAELRAGTQALAFHVLRRLGQSIAARESLADKPPPADVDALLLSALALVWPDGEAPYAEHTLVDEAVKAARKLRPASAAFVNAVLRRFLRERAAVVDAGRRTPAGRYNHPAWWVERLRRDWPDDWEALLAANDVHPPMTLRVNVRQGSVADYLERLVLAGLNARPVGSQGLVLERPCPVNRLPGFAEGDVSVQDAAAQQAAPLLLSVLAAASEGHRPRVLDACAAPGGKSAHLLELAEIDLLALDQDATRLMRVDETLERLHLSATTRAADASRPEDWWDGRPFDAILLDAPCTASGIVRRHPDVRWLRRNDDVLTLSSTQARLLDALWPTLAPGGAMLYCTCSVFKAEGADQIDAFLQRRPDAHAVCHPASPGHLLPLSHNHLAGVDGGGAALNDGFFYALLLKASPRV
jgi:16S rRNA (cytosine967-C5)-methyltransferase